MKLIKCLVLFFLILPVCASAGNLQDNDKQKRKYISRAYEATDGALLICENDKKTHSKKHLTNLKEHTLSLLS